MRTEEEIRSMLDFVKNKSPNIERFNYRDGWKLSLEWGLGEEG